MSNEVIVHSVEVIAEVPHRRAGRVNRVERVERTRPPHHGGNGFVASLPQWQASQEHWVRETYWKVSIGVRRDGSKDRNADPEAGVERFIFARIVRKDTKRAAMALFKSECEKAEAKTA